MTWPSIILLIMPILSYAASLSSSDADRTTPKQDFFYQFLREDPCIDAGDESRLALLNHNAYTPSHTNRLVPGS
jgi:hypothetical protein